MKTKFYKVKSKVMKSAGVLVAALVIIAMTPISASAHCDTMDGPTVVDGQKAMENDNINYALKWVQPDYEKEITEVFELSMKVKELSPEAKEIAEKYFFSELIRIHRAGESAPYTGLKPSGTPVDEIVLAADESIVVGNLSPLEGLIEEEKMPVLQERFDKVMTLKDFDVNDLEAGREYIEAYVMFFKFAEGEEEGHHAAGAHGEEAVDAHTEETSVDAHSEETDINASTEEVKETSSTNWIAWTLAGIFFVTTVVSYVKLFKSKRKQ